LCRHAYLQRRLLLDHKIASSQISNNIVEEALNTSLPNTYFLFFNIGRVGAWALLNMENGTVKAQKAFLNEQRLQEESSVPKSSRRPEHNRGLRGFVIWLFQKF